MYIGRGRISSHFQANLQYQLCCVLSHSVVSTLCNCMNYSQAPLSMGFSRQEYWSGLPFPSPGDIPYPGIEPGSPVSQTYSLLSATREADNQPGVLKFNSIDTIYLERESESDSPTLQGLPHCKRILYHLRHRGSPCTRLLAY